MAYADNSGSALTILFNFFKMKRANRYMKILLFFKENFIWSNLIFFALRPFFTLWLGMKLSQVTITIGSLNRQDIITFMINDGSLNSQDPLYN